MKILIYCAILCLLTGTMVYWAISRQQKKIAVVDAVQLFDNFNMKKELEELEKGKLQKASKQLDSMGNALQMAKGLNKTEQELRNLSYQYNYMKTKFDEDYTQSNRDINAQVWKRLNPLLDEYGKKHGLHLIIGANGMGSVLYTDEYYDITNDVTQYINKRYATGS